MMKEYMNLLKEVADSIRTVSDHIYNNPELGFEEFSAVEKQCALLENWGFALTHEVADLKTAFRADKKYGTGGPKFCIISEYDALPGMGHACGHNLICASALAAVYLADKMLSKKEIACELTLMGTPAEEAKGGKVLMVERGVFEGFDACMLAHPYDISSMDDGALSISHCRVIYHGHAAHAALAPEKGVNALDAMLQLFNGVALWRQRLPENSRIHGIITHGGTAPNIIPDYTEANYCIRAGDTQMQKEMDSRFREIAEGAALATGTTMELITDSEYKAVIFNMPLNEEYAKGMEEMGDVVRHTTGKEGRISTDFGNVTQLMPGAHVHFGICKNKRVPLHSNEFREAAGSSYAFMQALKAASAMARICVRYCSDKTFRKAVDVAYAESQQQ